MKLMIFIQIQILFPDQEQATAEQTRQQSVVPSPKKLQSKSDIQAPAAVLPEICPFCKKKAHYITAKGKRVKDKLAKAETESCGMFFLMTSDFNFEQVWFISTQRRTPNQFFSIFFPVHLLISYLCLIIF